MDTTLLLLLAVAAGVAIVSVLAIRRREETATMSGPPPEEPLAVSTEGMKVCPKCGMGNLWTDRTCMSCKAPLKG